MKKSVRIASTPGILALMGLLCMASATGVEAQDDSAKAAPAEPSAESVSTENFEALKGTVEGLNESFLETKNTVDKLAKIKFSGYVQTQWQRIDTNGAASISGGGFAPNSKQRFQVRRGRLKATYDNVSGQRLTSRYVLQIDVIPTGVTLKDAYVSLMEPWLKSFSYTMGVFDRPFGFEISYSSGSRESPERARAYQTLFPGERDMGAQLAFNAPETMGLLHYLNFKGGVFTGLGPTTNEIDNEQDLIGRLGFQAPIYTINAALDGGFSYYSGKVLAVNDTALSFSDTAFVRTVGNRGKLFDRTVMGVDAQFYYDLPVLGGMSLRGEYLWGEVPGTAAAAGPYAAAATGLYNREVAGWYVTWIQNLGSKVQGLVKYDVWDPNTAVDADDVRALVAPQSGRVAPSATDLAYATLGLGLVYHWDESLKFTGYYDIITNEEASSTGPAAFRDDRSDNVFTFRAQARF